MTKRLFYKEGETLRAINERQKIAIETRDYNKYPQGWIFISHDMAERDGESLKELKVYAINVEPKQRLIDKLKQYDNKE